MGRPGLPRPEAIPMDRPASAEMSARCFRCGRTLAEHTRSEDVLPPGTALLACPGFMAAPSLGPPRVRSAPPADREGASADPGDEAESSRDDD